MRFSGAARVTPGDDDDWFDPVLEQDSPLYIDPYLLFEDGDPFWSACKDEIVAFFELSAELVLASGEARNTPAWRKATRLLRFPEPYELSLGVALGTPRGSGTGEKFATQIAEVLALIGTSDLPRLASIGGFALFCEGIGVDRISDIVANIIKAKLISYTKSVLVRHGVATNKVDVAHASWEASSGRWLNSSEDLFLNPATGGGVLLVPKRFLKDIPRVEVDGFWDWASAQEGAMLRDDLSFDLSELLSASEKVAAARKVARSRPELAIRYIKREDDQTHTPYDVVTDPRGLVYWYEKGLEAASLVSAASMTSKAPTALDDLEAWVLALAMDFQFVIENTDAWRILWDDKLTVHRQEKIAQAVASVMWRSRCQAANVDIAKEANIGRGPVDFKFSQGWERRALIELKLIGSSHFAQGAAKQLPQYLKSEQIAFGVYLVIGFKKSDFEPKRLKQVNDTVAKIASALECKIKVVVVDARPKASASKL